MNKDSLLEKVFFFLFVFLGLALLMAIFYINRNFAFYNTNPIAQILFHVLVQIDGANPEFIKGIVLQIVILPLIGSLVITIFLFSNIKLLQKFQSLKFIQIIKKYSIVLSSVFFIVSFVLCASKLELVDYIKTYTQSSTLYEDEYVDPATANYTFPEKKRNLIYLFLESVETSDYSIEQGGAFKDCYIPELYELANNNITFNDNKGFYTAPNTGWTIGAMVGQSAGIPLTIPVEANSFVTDNKFMPGAYSIGGVLENNGYKNILLIGSDAVFGGRQYYYEKHGNYEIRDYDYAVNNGLVDPDDYVWWGYEDYQLYEFAKQDLLELASSGEPFNYTMLTVDTHHNDGWMCKLCKNEFDEHLGNAYACTSRQATEFIEWCKKQDFYENTTIVVCGDHCSMDAHFDELLTDFDRKVYFTIINPADGCIETKDRQICTFDLYPTTVASIGVQIEGNRLGLGTNLFSNEQTLCEKYGKGKFFSEVFKNSTYYNNHILYGIE